jgi:hypothetical protein
MLRYGVVEVGISRQVLFSTTHVSESVGALGQDDRRFRDWTSSDNAFLTINNLDPKKS